jgi:hypothetical protein
MQLFIGNPTNQPATFLYRKLENKKVLRQDIPIGGQIQIAGPLSPDDISYIVDQHAKYGLVRADEVDTNRRFTSLCYSVDKVISTNRLESAMRSNQFILIERGKKQRQEAAIADAVRMENTVIESGRQERLVGYEATIVEHNPDARNDTPPVAEGIRVSRTVNPDGSPRGSAKSGRRRKVA